MSITSISCLYRSLLNPYRAINSISSASVSLTLSVNLTKLLGQYRHQSTHRSSGSPWADRSAASASPSTQAGLLPKTLCHLPLLAFLVPCQCGCLPPALTYCIELRDSEVRLWAEECSVWFLALLCDLEQVTYSPGLSLLICEIGQYQHQPRRDVRGTRWDFAHKALSWVHEGNWPARQPLCAPQGLCELRGVSRCRVMPALPHPCTRAASGGLLSTKSIFSSDQIALS